MMKYKTSSVCLKGTPAFERMRSFLGSYRSCRTICEQKNVKAVESSLDGKSSAIREAFFEECRVRCAEIERFIAELDCREDEKTLLRLHYLEGMSIERASEFIYVSRSTAFRIIKRAEEAALNAFIELESDRMPPERSVS